MDAQEGLDAEMIARVFRLLKIIEFRQASQVCHPFGKTRGFNQDVLQF
jgi:hypothetical protein